MMYGLIRFFVAGIVFVICVVLIMRAKAAQRKRKYAFAIGACLILWVILGLIPFENTFLTFSTPEDAYRYVYAGDPVLIVSGTNTDLVIAKESSSVHNIEIIPKMDDGWKIGLGINMKIVYYFSDGLSITIYQHKKSKDCYIEVATKNDGLIELRDSQNSQFFNLDVPEDEIYGFPTSFFAFIKEPGSDYCVYLNGAPYPLAGLAFEQ